MAARKKKTETGYSPFKHVDYLDINETGVMDEVAVVKRWEDGSLSYIPIATLDQIDKGRIKKIISGVHADKYELWELMSQSKLSNGMNALDFFHANLIKIKRPEGAINGPGPGGSLMDAKITDDAVIGADYSDPASAIANDGGIPMA